MEPQRKGKKRAKKKKEEGKTPSTHFVPTPLLLVREKRKRGKKGGGRREGRKGKVMAFNLTFQFFNSDGGEREKKMQTEIKGEGKQGGGGGEPLISFSS